MITVITQILLLLTICKAFDCSKYGFEGLDGLYVITPLPVDERYFPGRNNSDAINGRFFEPKKYVSTCAFPSFGSDNIDLFAEWSPYTEGGCLIESKAYFSPCTTIRDIKECENSQFCIVETLRKVDEYIPLEQRVTDKLDGYVEEVELDSESLRIYFRDDAGSDVVMIRFFCSEKEWSYVGLSNAYDAFQLNVGTPNVCEFLPSKKSSFLSLQNGREAVSGFQVWASRILRRLRRSPTGNIEGITTTANTSDYSSTDDMHEL